MSMADRLICTQNDWVRLPQTPQMFVIMNKMMLFVCNNEQKCPCGEIGKHNSLKPSRLCLQVQVLSWVLFMVKK